MQYITDVRYLVAIGAALLAFMPGASAQDVVKGAAVQRGAWETAAPQLGQQAGLFKMHGIVLEVLYMDGEIERRVISRRVDGSGCWHDGGDARLRQRSVGRSRAATAR
jgi:hypothetical protein